MFDMICELFYIITFRYSFSSETERKTVKHFIFFLLHSTVLKVIFLRVVNLIKIIFIKYSSIDLSTMSNIYRLNCFVIVKIISCNCQQSSRGGISVDTDYRTADITSRLTVAMVRPEDAGNYTCEDINVKPDTVTVVVFEGIFTYCNTILTIYSCMLYIYSRTTNNSINTTHVLCYMCY